MKYQIDDSSPTHNFMVGDIVEIYNNDVCKDTIAILSINIDIYSKYTFYFCGNNSAAHLEEEGFDYWYFKPKNKEYYER